MTISFSDSRGVQRTYTVKPNTDIKDIGKENLTGTISFMKGDKKIEHILRDRHYDTLTVNKEGDVVEAGEVPWAKPAPFRGTYKTID